MESCISGQIEYRQIPASRALRRFAEKQINNWIERKTNRTKPVPARYLVEIQKEGSGHTFNCHVEVKLGSQTWVGRNYEGSLHQALIQCLRQMVALPAIP